jgi:DNA-binding LytR/AlgR family response regulator
LRAQLLCIMKYKLRCIAIDDYNHDLKQIEAVVKFHPGLIMIRTYNDPVKALASIKKTDDIDIIFLDIEMPGIDGISLGTQLRNKTKYLVFITAFEQYALRSFAASPENYLLKPISKVAFMECIAKIRDKPVFTAVSRNQMDDNLFLPTKNGNHLRISREEIILFEPITGTNYTKVYTVRENFEVLVTLVAIEGYLRDDSRFMRISRSGLINLDQIDHVASGKVFMNTQEKKQMSIGSDYAALFNNYLSERMFGKSD